MTTYGQLITSILPIDQSLTPKGYRAVAVPDEIVGHGECVLCCFHETEKRRNCYDLCQPHCRPDERQVYFIREPTT